MSSIPEIEEPDPNAIIWKYMDLSKFILFLKNGLWFQRVDLLEDKFEGKLSTMSGYLDGIYPGKSNIYDTNFINSSRKFYEINRKWYVVNCWNLNKYESIALWNLYIKGDCGVAIRSTFSKLKKAIREKSDKTRLVGKVTYIDRTKEKIPMSPMLLSAFYKDFIFRHEEEVRALIIYQERVQSINDDPGFTGFYVPVDLNEVIEKVVIAPKLSSWKFELVKQLISENKLEKSVYQSSFDNES